MGNLTNSFATTPASEFDATKVATYNGALQIHDDMIAGRLPIVTTGGTTTLTGTPAAPQAQNLFIDISGTLASNAIIEIPVAVGTGRNRVYIVKNGTSGAFTVTFRAVGQTGSLVTQGYTGLFLYNNTDVVRLMEVPSTGAATTLLAVAGSDGDLQMKSGSALAASGLNDSGTLIASTRPMRITASDAVTNALTDVQTFRHNSSGTPAANFGSGLLFNLESNTTENRDAARLGVLWGTATDATRSSWLVGQTVLQGGALAERFRIGGTRAVGYDVGFGTTDPVFNDDWTTGGSVGVHFAIDGAVSGYAAYLGLGGTVPGVTSPVGALCFYNKSMGGVDNRTAMIYSENDGALGQGDLVFSTSPNNVGPLPRMKIAYDGTIRMGNVGISGGTLAVSTLTGGTAAQTWFNIAGTLLGAFYETGNLVIGNVNQPTGGSGPVIALAEATSNPTGQLNCAGLVCKDVAGVSHLFAWNESKITQLTPTVTNDNAVAGAIGEYITGTLAVGSAISLTTNTVANVISISLTAGDWDVTGVVVYLFPASTSFTRSAAGITTTSATFGTFETATSVAAAANVPGAGATHTQAAPVVRISLAATTTVYLIAYSTFTVSTLQAYGFIRARRVR